MEAFKVENADGMGELVAANITMKSGGQSYVYTRQDFVEGWKNGNFANFDYANVVYTVDVQTNSVVSVDVSWDDSSQEDGKQNQLWTFTLNNQLEIHIWEVTQK